MAPAASQNLCGAFCENVSEDPAHIGCSDNEQDCCANGGVVAEAVVATSSVDSFGLTEITLSTAPAATITTGMHVVGDRIGSAEIQFSSAVHSVIDQTTFTLTEALPLRAGDEILFSSSGGQEPATCLAGYTPAQLGAQPFPPSDYTRCPNYRCIGGPPPPPLLTCTSYTDCCNDGQCTNYGFCSCDGPAGFHSSALGNALSDVRLQQCCARTTTKTAPTIGPAASPPVFHMCTPAACRHDCAPPTVPTQSAAFCRLVRRLITGWLGDRGDHAHHTSRCRVRLHHPALGDVLLLHQTRAGKRQVADVDGVHGWLGALALCSTVPLLVREQTVCCLVMAGSIMCANAVLLFSQPSVPVRERPCLV